MKHWIAKGLSIASSTLLLAGAVAWIRSERVVDEFAWVNNRGDVGLITGGSGFILRSMRYAVSPADQAASSATFQHITAAPDGSPSNWSVRYTHTDRSTSLFIPFWMPMSMLAGILVLAHFGTPTVAPGNPPASR